MDNAAALLAAVYDRIGAHTPLNADCGLLCDAVCCRGGSDDGMLLYPGEADVLGIADAEALPLVMLSGGIGARLYNCAGRCERDMRPLGCRIFPLHMRPGEKGIRVIMHPWATPVCPLVGRGGVAGLSRGFVEAVADVGRMLMGCAQMRAFITALDAQLREDMAHPLFVIGDR